MGHALTLRLLLNRAMPTFCDALLVVGCVIGTASAAQPAGPLRVDSANPRYFTDGSGKAIYLTGSHHWDNFQRWFEGQPGAPSGPAGRLGGFEGYLDVLQVHGHNFIRLWVADTAWSPITKAAIEPQPYVRSGPGKAADGGLKFHLNRLNQAYFDELRARVLAARKRGIYVGVMLFNGWGVGVYQDRPHSVTWDYHPFNKANNVNGIDGDPNGDRRGVECHSLQIPAITKLQETYVRKVLDTVNDLDNVLYEISNESGPGSAKWQCHLIRYIKDSEAAKPKQHPVIMSGGWGMPNADLFASPADAVAPGSETKERYATDPPPATGAKVVIIDSDHNGSKRTDAEYAWKSFLRGHNPIVMDWWNGSQWTPLRRALGQTRRYADKMNLAAMTPRSDLASTTYCLANPGKEYLVYMPKGGEATLELSTAKASLAVEWMNTIDGNTTRDTTMGGGKRVFKAPFAGPAILHLTANTAGAAAREQVVPRKGWASASPESQGVDPAKLKAAVEYLAGGLKDYGGAGTLFIVRNGYVIWAGPECDRQYQIFSATKSFTSTVLGLLFDDGKVTLDTLAKDLEPALAKQYPAVTLRHFATMTSGYDSVGGSYEFDHQKRGDSWNPGPPAPPLFPPGSRFRYWDDAMMQFGSLLTKAAGEPLDRLFRRRIADPIGMTKWKWTENDTPTGRVLCWTGGIHTSSRELARFGHLFLNRGNWNGRSLISAAWVDQATSVQVPASIPNDNLPRSRGAGVYGYNWWINGVTPNGQRLWPGAPPRTYYANGLHNNVCVVVPEWNMVIARTNGTRERGGTNTPPNVDEIWSGFFSRLGKALAASSNAEATGPGH